MFQITDHPLYGKHDIDSAMNSFWRFYKSRFLTLFLTSFIMAVIIQYGTSYFLNMKDLQSNSDPMVLLAKMKDYIVPIIAISLVGLVFNNILHYYILFNPLDSGKNIFISVIYSLKYFIPYLIIVVLLAFYGSLALALGLAVFIVGVVFSLIYLMMVSLFIMPVMMAEGTNIAHTIRRTLKLSHHSFWSNIGWTSVFVILIVIISVVLSALIMLPFTGSFVKSIINPEEAGKALEITKNPIYLILTAGVSALTMPAIPIFGFLLYFNGRARDVVDLPPVYGDENYKVTVDDLYSKPLPENNKEEKRAEDRKG